MVCTIYGRGGQEGLEKHNTGNRCGYTLSLVGNGPSLESQ